MLKKVEKKSLKKSENIPSYKNFPKSEKVYVKGKIFKDIKIGMRKISLQDKDFKNLTVYDTSGFYSDPNYKHNYERTFEIKTSEVNFVSFNRDVFDVHRRSYNIYKVFHRRLKM